MFDLYHPAFSCHRGFYEWSMHHWNNVHDRFQFYARGEAYQRAISYGLRPEFAAEFAAI